MRVLVIEFDPSIATLPTDRLADEGQATVEAVTTGDGLERARAGPWDACVTDGFWPEVVAQSRAYLAELARCCPVILLSARPWAQAARPADLGFAAVVRKPFDLNNLLGVLAIVVRSATS